MLKTPKTASLLAALTLLAGPGAATAANPSAAPGLNAFDSRSDTVAAPDNGFAIPGGVSRPEFDASATNRAPGGAGDLAADSGALPLAQFAREETRPGARPSATGFRALVARVRGGGLPEPASWAMMLIGFGMIGGAMRGFVVANRRLAGLQPEDMEQGGSSKA